MAFKRRGTGRDEMLKRNMERLAKRRRDRKNKPEKKKEELKVNKEEAPKFPPLTAPPQAYPDAPPPVPKEPKQPESQNEQVETPPASPRENRFADLRGNTPENPNTEKDASYRSAGAGPQPEVKPKSNNQSDSDKRNTEATQAVKRGLKKFFSSVQKQLAKTPSSSQGIRIGTKNRAGKFWA